MKKSIVITFSVVCLYCTPPTDSNDLSYRIIPDSTPYIAGLIEATNDTVHHYPEVFVAYVSDPAFVEDPFNYFFYDNGTVYNNTLWAQIKGTIQVSRLVTEHEAHASVQVTGPVGQADERTVTYTYQDEGIYGDVNSELILKAEATYRLDVTLPDGRRYTRSTTIPAESFFDVPDTTYTQVDLYHYQDGTPHENNMENHPHFKFSTPEGTYISEYQYNSSHDEHLLFTPLDEFLFAEKSPFLRRGIIYAVITQDYPGAIDSLNQRWNVDISKMDKTDPNLNRRLEWFRMSHFSKDIGQRFRFYDEWISVMGDEIRRLRNIEGDFFVTRDSTYLKKVSTILKRAEDGSILPKEQSDAIGFFAGYFSNYETSVLIPRRSFDVDSVLSN